LSRRRPDVVVVEVAVVVPVVPPTAGAGDATGSVEACTSIIDELSVALLVAAAGSVVLAAVRGAVVAGCIRSDAVESGAGAGELSCA
jgi:hypothetical protein